MGGEMDKTMAKVICIAIFVAASVALGSAFGGTDCVQPEVNARITLHYIIYSAGQ